MSQDPTRRSTRPSWRLATLIVVAVALGLVIAGIDSRPGWDDTGTSAGLLLLGTATITAVAGARPWLWAILVGAPTPITEILSTGNTGSTLALVFASIGAAVGWWIGSIVRGADGGGRR
jgi:hypothetical protein